MRVLICGSRGFTDSAQIREEVRKLSPDSVVVHGGARGADSFAGEAARECGLAEEVFLADWTRHGKAAGFIRNKKMVEEGKPDEVWAFYNDCNHPSPGTAHTVSLAKKIGVPVTIFTPVLK